MLAAGSTPWREAEPQAIRSVAAGLLLLLLGTARVGAALPALFLAPALLLLLWLLLHLLLLLLLRLMLASGGRGATGGSAACAGGDQGGGRQNLGLIGQAQLLEGKLI